MRIVYVMTGILAFLLLLTGFGSEEVRKSAATADRALRALDEFEMAEIMLHRDLLRARAGMLRNYDSMADAHARMRGAIAHLRREIGREADLAKSVDRLSQRAAAEEHWTGQLEILPQTEDVMKSVFAVANGGETAELRAQLHVRRQLAGSRATTFRYVLFGFATLLGIALLCLVRTIRQRAAWLRKRAAIEHSLATISTRFITARAEETGKIIQQALHELGVSCGAERTYFIVASGPGPAYTWSRGNAAFPPQWPEASMEVAGYLSTTADEAIHVPDSRALPDTFARDTLRSAGVHVWLYIRGCVKGRQAALGFDFARRNVVVSSAEFALLRMAFDAIANAVDRDAMERDRARLEASLQEARRMETVGTLASGIAHNFNNIVGAIVGFAESAQTHLEAGRDVSESLAEIRGAGERARGLVDQILTFGRRPFARRTPTCLKLLVREAKTLLEASLPAGIDIEVHDGAEVAIVDAEVSQLQQVILNVCNNAAQAMDAAGRIGIAVELHDSTGLQRLDCGELTAGRYVVLSITDTGKGMDASIRERMFEPFFTTRTAGNGLGLATVREIVLDHGGALRVKSAPDAGTRFEIWLPRMQAEPATPPDRPIAPDRGRGESILVLEVDRERLLRHEEFVAALGYEPVGFTHGAEACAAFHLSPARFDAALLCNHSALSESVLAIAASLRRRAPQFPIILATASARDLDAQDLANAGIAAVIGQPLALSELAHTLARHLQSPLQL